MPEFKSNPAVGFCCCVRKPNWARQDVCFISTVIMCHVVRLGGVCNAVAGAQMRVGTGIFDATGEVAQVNFMGYAMMNQVGAGLHQRLRARAYYVDDGENIVFVSVDFGLGSHAVKVRALELLQQDNVTKGTFTLDNLCVSGARLWACWLHESPFVSSNIAWLSKHYI